MDRAEAILFIQTVMITADPAEILKKYRDMTLREALQHELGDAAKYIRIDCSIDDCMDL